MLICVFFKLRCNDFHSVILLKENPTIDDLEFSFCDVCSFSFKHFFVVVCVAAFCQIKPSRNNSVWAELDFYTLNLLL